MTTKESIVNEALSLFAQYGYEITTIRAIVDKVGIKESSFYNHYLGKKDLHNEILKVSNDFFEQQDPSIAEREKWAKQCNNMMVKQPENG